MLTSSQLKQLRSQAHHLNPVIWVGANGVTESVIAELSQTLDTHELIKVKLLHDDRDSRAEFITEMIQATGAEKVQTIGKIVVLFRRNSKNPKITLSK